MNTFTISHENAKHSIIISVISITTDMWKGLSLISGKPPVVSLNEDRTIKHYTWEFANEEFDFPEAYAMLRDAGWEVAK